MVDCENALNLEMRRPSEFAPSNRPGADVFVPALLLSHRMQLLLD